VVDENGSLSPEIKIRSRHVQIKRHKEDDQKSPPENQGRKENSQEGQGCAPAIGPPDPRAHAEKPDIMRQYVLFFEWIMVAVGLILMALPFVFKDYG